jgi:branched-chain amino acid transport system substrate-binding protein
MTANKDSARMTRRQFLRTAAVLGGAAAAGPLLAACGAPGLGGASGPLKIGLLLPSSGIYAALGESITNGMKMYLDSVNNKAGGRDIQLIAEDEGTDPQPAALALSATTSTTTRNS